MDLKRVSSELLGRLRACWPSLVAVHLAMAALGFAVLTPAVGLVTRLLLALGGRTVVADLDIAWFLLSPIGALSLVLVAALLVAIAALELAALMAVALAARDGRRLGVAEALTVAGAQLRPMLHLALRVVIGILVRLLPFAALAVLVAAALLADHDVNYYLAARPPELVAALALVALLGAAAVAVVARRLVAWSLAMPLALFDGLAVRRALARSAELTAGRRAGLLALFAAWAALALGVGSLGLGLVELTGSLLLPRLSGSLGLVVAATGGLLLVGGIGNVVATGVLNGGLAVLVVVAHERLAGGRPAAPTVGLAEPGRAGPRLVVALVAAAALAAVGLGGWLLEAARLPDRAVVVAHRGAAGRAPENTLAAVRAAIADGADWVEVDVQETADGEVVVVHDRDFMKLCGLPLRVADATLEEVRRLDVGSWFGPGFAGEGVPTLAEVLEEIAGSEARLLVELKDHGRNERLEERVIERVEAAGLETRVAIMSLEQEGVRRVRALRPGWNVGLLAATAVGDLRRVDADFLAVHRRLAEPGLVRRLHRSGRRVLVWTLNDRVSLSRAMSIGADGVITDEPGLAVEVLRERAAMGPAERLLVSLALHFGVPEPRRAPRDDSP